jgi:ubiquinol-cytochrome c reductase cytochrome c subunit
MRRLPLLAVVLATLAATAAGVARASSDARDGKSSSPPAAQAADEDLEEARRLFLLGCASCHGERGQGTDVAPSLEQAGAASAYYYLATGRMPMADYEQQPRRKDVAYSERQIDLLVAFVARLGDGPPLPHVDPAGGDLAEGGVLYRLNCAPCHAAAGIGGALSYGRAAPSVHDASPLVVGAAVRAGPGQMPVFGPEVLDTEELDAVVRYVRYLRDPARPGGAALGGAGPVPEGFVAWVFGVGALLLATFWIGSRLPGDPPEVVEPGAEEPDP